MSQIQAPENVIKDMVRVNWKKSIRRNCSEVYETNEVDFHAPIKQNKLHTFESAVNVRKVKGERKNVTVRSKRDTFA